MMITAVYFLGGVVVGSSISFLSTVYSDCLNTIFRDNDQINDILPTMCDVITQTNTIINKEVSSLTTKCIKEHKDGDDDSSATTEVSVSDDGETNESTFYNIFLPLKKNETVEREVHVRFKN
jgi:hypothetical protein